MTIHSVSVTACMSVVNETLICQCIHKEKALHTLLIVSIITVASYVQRDAMCMSGKECHVYKRVRNEGNLTSILYHFSTSICTVYAQERGKGENNISVLSLHSQTPGSAVRPTLT